MAELNSLDSTIIAAIISGVFTLLSSCVIAFFISRYLIKFQNKLEEEQKERLAFKEPSHSKILFDSQKLIKYTQRAYIDLLTHYFYKPWEYLEKLDISNETSEKDIDEKIKDFLISKNEKRTKTNFDELRDQGFTTFYAFYFSITNGLIYLESIEIIRQYYLLNDYLPIPHPEIKKLSDNIFDKIIATPFSNEFHHFIELLKDPNIKFIDQKSRFNMYWLQKTHDFIDSYQNLEKLYNELWNKVPTKK